MSKSRIRVIQGYTGTIAKAQIRMIARHPDVELVGTLVHHEDKVGLDAGDIAGIEPLGVAATNSLDDILALDADVVLYNPPTDTLTDVVPILA